MHPSIGTTSSSTSINNLYDTIPKGIIITKGIIWKTEYQGVVSGEPLKNKARRRITY